MSTAQQRLILHLISCAQDGRPGVWGHSAACAQRPAGIWHQDRSTGSSCWPAAPAAGAARRHGQQQRGAPCDTAAKAQVPALPPAAACKDPQLPGSARDAGAAGFRQLVNFWQTSAIDIQLQRQQPQQRRERPAGQRQRQQHAAGVAFRGVQRQTL